MLSQETDHVSPTEVIPELGKGALDTWRPHGCLGGRLDKTGDTQLTVQGGEAVGKPGGVGVDTHQRLNLSKPWEGPRRICQGFKPYSGDPTVRHYRGASGNVRHGETVTPVPRSKERERKPLTYSGARPNSIPTMGEDVEPYKPVHETTADSAELARSKSGVALSTLHHVLDLEWMKEAYRLTRKDGAPWHRRGDGSRVRAKPGGQSYGSPGTHQVWPLSSSTRSESVYSEDGWIGIA
jgi:hypothetical protein